MTKHQTYFRKEVPELIKLLKSDQKPLWGQMNSEMMINHLLAGTKLFLSGAQLELETPLEMLPKFKAFLMSDKPFKPGAKKPGAYAEYEKTSLAGLDNLKAAFVKELTEFDRYTTDNPELKAFHPNFGELNAEELRQLQYKHIQHHFTQFGLMTQ